MCRGAPRDPAEFEKEEFKDTFIKPFIKKFARRKNCNLAVRRLLLKHKRAIEVSNLFGLDFKFDKIYQYKRGKRVAKYCLSVQETPQEVSKPRRGLFSDSDEESIEEESVGRIANQGENETGPVPDRVISESNLKNWEELSVESQETDTSGEFTSNTCDCPRCKPVVLEDESVASSGSSTTTQQSQTREDRALIVGNNIFNLIDQHREEENHPRLISIKLYFDCDTGLFVTPEYINEIQSTIGTTGEGQLHTYHF